MALSAFGIPDHPEARLVAELIPALCHVRGSEDPRDRRSWSAHYPGWAPLATPIRFDVRIWLRGCRLRSSPIVDRTASGW